MSDRGNNYKKDLLKDLGDPSYAQSYVAAAALESQDTFLLALRDVAEARMGMSQLATEANVNRENLYRMLSEDGNPRLNTLSSVLDALGFHMTIALNESQASNPAPVAPISSFTETRTIPEVLHSPTGEIFGSPVQSIYTLQYTFANETSSFGTRQWRWGTIGEYAPNPDPVRTEVVIEPNWFALLGSTMTKENFTKELV